MKERTCEHCGKVVLGKCFDPDDCILGHRPVDRVVSVRWMPIETAPTDGTQILLMKMPLRDQVRMAVADGFMANGRWVWPYVHKEPTHWMPMLTAH